MDRPIQPVIRPCPPYFITGVDGRFVVLLYLSRERDSSTYSSGRFFNRHVKNLENSGFVDDFVFHRSTC